MLLRACVCAQNLAMWMRAKYPWVVSGAIASSVSVQKHLLRSSNIFWQIVTQAYHNVSATCPKLIRAVSLLRQRARNDCAAGTVLTVFVVHVRDGTK